MRTRSRKRRFAAFSTVNDSSSMLPTPHSTLSTPRSDFGSSQPAAGGERIVCDSQDGPTTKADLIVCSRCLNLQDTACMISADGTKETPPAAHCNNCKVEVVYQTIAAQQERIEQLRIMVEQKRISARNFLATPIWKHYCNLPNGNASETVCRLTATIHERGRMMPVFAAPQGWVNEIQINLGEMIRDADRDVLERIMGPNNNPTKSSELAVVSQWRAVPLWMLHQGPYRGDTARLGLLAEVLGLEETGTFWKGE